MRRVLAAVGMGAVYGILACLYLASLIVVACGAASLTAWAFPASVAHGNHLWVGFGAVFIYFFASAAGMSEWWDW